MPEFIIKELYGKSITNIVPQSTERMKQMYSSLVSDSESSSFVSDNCSMSSKEEGDVESPILHISDNDRIATPRTSLDKSFERRRRSCYENEMESHTLCAQQKLDGFISPIRATSKRNKEGHDEIPCRSNCVRPSQNNIEKFRSTYYGTIQSKRKQASKKGYTNEKESSLQNNSSLEGGKGGMKRPNCRKFQEIMPEKNTPISSLQQIARSGKLDVSNQRKGSTLECLNPYYCSVQDTLEATGNSKNEVVVYGKSPLHSKNRKLLGRQISNDRDDDQRTLITTSETVTVISEDVSHFMTDAGTVQSGTEDDQVRGLANNNSVERTRKDVGIEHEVGLYDGLDELCPHLKVGMKDIATIIICDSSISRNGEQLKNLERVQSDNADEGSIAETTLVSLASDEVATSIDIGEVAIKMGEVPRDISFCHANQIEYTSFRDLMGTTQKEAVMKRIEDASLSANIKSRRYIKPIDKVAGVVNEANRAAFHCHGKTCSYDEYSKDGDIQCEDKIRKDDPETCMGMSHSTMRDASSKLISSLEKANFPEDKDERGSQVSNQETPEGKSSSSFYEDESVISTDVSIRNNIVIGSIKDLDVFRKEKCADDECSFGHLFGDECKCTIM